MKGNGKMKVYIVMCNDDNLMDYEDSNVIDYVLGVFSSREKAKAFIDNWIPQITNGERIIDNPSEIKTELGWAVEPGANAERVVYIHSENTWNRSYCELTIDEREVDT